MKFAMIIPKYNHLWAVKAPDEEVDELTLLFRKWNNAEYLLDFFMENFEDLRSFFKIERLDQAIEDTFEDAGALEELILEFPYTENLDELFKPLDITDTKCIVVTGGAIKLSRTMQEREHTALELDKLNRCKAFLKANGVFDQDSFVELTNED